MGRLVEEEALRRSHQVVSIVDPKAKRDDSTTVVFPALSLNAIEMADMVIDFTHPSAVLENVRAYCETNVRAVIGTTGWYDKLSDVREIVSNSRSAILWSSNFSIGVNLFFQIVEAASVLFNNAPDYDVWGYELHHHHKVDSPSGTAKTLCELVTKNIARKERPVFDKLDRKIDPSELHFASIRGGAVNFEHTLAFDSEADTITIKHSARTRAGYALGAVHAAEWLSAKAPGLYGPEDFMSARRT
jgi:4-hydroxy-tetrahydrodipicolinate reductase